MGQRLCSCCVTGGPWAQEPGSGGAEGARRCPAPASPLPPLQSVQTRACTTDRLTRGPAKLHLCSQLPELRLLSARRGHRSHRSADPAVNMRGVQAASSIPRACATGAACRAAEGAPRLHVPRASSLAWRPGQSACKARRGRRPQRGAQAPAITPDGQVTSRPPIRAAGTSDVGRLVATATFSRGPE